MMLVSLRRHCRPRTLINVLVISSSHISQSWSTSRLYSSSIHRNDQDDVDERKVTYQLICLLSDHIYTLYSLPFDDDIGRWDNFRCLDILYIHDSHWSLHIIGLCDKLQGIIRQYCIFSHRKISSYCRAALSSVGDGDDEDKDEDASDNYEDAAAADDDDGLNEMDISTSRKRVESTDDLVR